MMLLLFPSHLQLLLLLGYGSNDLKTAGIGIREDILRRVPHYDRARAACLDGMDVFACLHMSNV
jgi:hypothetical protein